VDKVRLKNGTEVVIRPISAADGPGIQAAYRRLSPESRYRRFLTPKPYLSNSETTYLVNVDGQDHYALVAVLADAPRVIVGVVRFVRLRDEPKAAEFAVVVGDPYHRQGLATALLARLMDVAREHGIERFRATMLAQNAAAQNLVLGLSPRTHLRRRGTIDEIDVDLTARPELAVR
jgi:RimJ/RimL family protein N-acetyltransferase